VILCGHQLIQRRNCNKPADAAVPILNNIKRANNRSMSCVKTVWHNTILLCLYTIVGRDQCNDNNNNNNNNNDDTILITITVQ